MKRYLIIKDIIGKALLISLLFNEGIVYSQNSSDYEIEKCYLHPYIIELRMTQKHTKEFVSDEEGGFYHFTMEDQTKIIVSNHKMAMFLPVDTLRPNKSFEKDSISIKMGQFENTKWRKDVYKNFKIYYMNVPPISEKIYNSLLDSVRYYKP